MSDIETRCYKISGMEHREKEGRRYLEGYFARFNEPYTVCDGWVETIQPGAFRSYLESGGDVKALWNHNHDVVLGSRSNGTLELVEDEQGLRGRIEINEQDTDAMNVYARVQRGDVDGCSFGFDAEMDKREEPDGTLHTTIREVSSLYEVSPCTFPAYETTSIAARCRQQLETMQTEQRARRLQDWRARMHKKLKGE